jgi:hypothetical protein
MSSYFASRNVPDENASTNVHNMSGIDDESGVYGSDLIGMPPVKPAGVTVGPAKPFIPNTSSTQVPPTVSHHVQPFIPNTSTTQVPPTVPHHVQPFIPHTSTTQAPPTEPHVQPFIPNTSTTQVPPTAPHVQPFIPNTSTTQAPPTEPHVQPFIPNTSTTQAPPLPPHVKPLVPNTSTTQVSPTVPPAKPFIANSSTSQVPHVAQIPPLSKPVAPAFTLMGPNNQTIPVSELFMPDKSTMDTQKVLIVLWRMRFTGAPFCQLLDVFT